MRATALGSFPGTDMRATIRWVLGELDVLAPVPELPGRGVGAQMIGRTTAVLEGLAADLQPGGWRLTEASGIDHRRARSLLRQDLDDLEELAQGWSGTLKLSVAGPFTLAAELERPRGDKALADHGARAELVGSLAEGLANLLSELRRRLPDAKLMAQLDEPMLPAVMSGGVKTASGFSRHRTVHLPEVAAAFTALATAVGDVPIVVHCCAPGLDLTALGSVSGVSLPASQLRTPDLDRLGPWLEAGRSLLIGVHPTWPVDEKSSVDAGVGNALAFLRPLDLDPDLLTRTVTLTPDCGLAGWTPGAAVTCVRTVVRASNLVDEQLHR
ncbi:MAG TPA: methionine synthase [Propionibacteriaceae bacterium]|nr:methionine synthase [Propionibacteriaceae bacterium]